MPSKTTFPIGLKKFFPRNFFYYLPLHKNFPDFFFFSLIYLKIRGNRGNRGNLGVMTPFISPKRLPSADFGGNLRGNFCGSLKKNGVTTPFYFKLLEKSRDFLAATLA